MNIRVILSDLARTCLFVKDQKYLGTLNELHATLIKDDNEYNFFDYFELSYEYLEFLKSLSKELQLYMFTSGVIQNKTELKSILESYFIEVLSPNEIGFAKDDAKAYINIAERIGIDPSEILFIDDDPKFIQAGEKAGLTTYQFDNNGNLQNYINTHILDKKVNSK